MIVDVYIENIHGGYHSYIVPQKLKNKIEDYIRVEVLFQNRKRTALIIHSRSKREYSLDFSHLEPIRKVIDEHPMLTREQIQLSNRLAEFYFTDPSVFLFLMLPSARREFSDSNANGSIQDGLWHPLNNEQRTVLNEFNRNIQENKRLYCAHLLHGITGSGKTRVYAEIIKERLSKGQGVILLLPEIALASKMAEIIESYFPDQCAVFHSQKSRGSRLEIYKKVLLGEKKLVVGTRSAIFLPVKNLSLVIIDEEHDGSYKNSRVPHYHARVVAGLRLKSISEKENRPVQLILGSATPSIEMYYRSVNEKKIYYYTMKKMASTGELPVVSVINNPASEKELVSFALRQKIESHLNAGNSILLLMNRRGHSRISRCRQCQTVVMCSHCSVPMAFHKSGIMKCHMCGNEMPYDDTCHHCGGAMQLYGSGTQKIEDYLEKQFPGVPYGRLDRDSARIKGHADDIIEAMQNGKIRIMLGTQMIAKGFDLKNVTLMGILDADIGLNLPDYRAGERIFQLIVQAAGRSGRHKAGEVLVQTSSPDHPIIQFAINRDYSSFADHEISLRRIAEYPPFFHIVRLLGKGRDQRELKIFMEKLRQILLTQNPESELFSEKAEKEPFEILGPVPAPFEKLKGEYRFHILLKDKNLKWSQNYMKYVLYSSEKLKKKYHGLKMEIDIDPVDIL